MRRVIAFLAAACAGFLACPPASAFDVQPVVNVIELPRDTRGISIAITNPRQVPLPLTFEVVERIVEIDGSENHVPADEDFVIFPPQAIINPGETQAVRLQYVGASPSESRSFTFFSTEVPVSESELETTGVQRILRMGASVHVAPAGSRPKPVLVGAESAEGGMRITIRNDGARFVYVDNISLQFEDRAVEGYELANIAGRTLIPPGKTRSFVVPETSGTPVLRLITPFL